MQLYSVCVKQTKMHLRHCTAAAIYAELTQFIYTHISLCQNALSTAYSVKNKVSQ